MPKADELFYITQIRSPFPLVKDDFDFHINPTFDRKGDKVWPILIVDFVLFAHAKVD
ncbi:MAG: hypothetical protein ACOYXT_22065 [Bacteroidota bacterium]